MNQVENHTSTRAVRNWGAGIAVTFGGGAASLNHYSQIPLSLTLILAAGAAFGFLLMMAIGSARL